MARARIGSLVFEEWPANPDDCYLIEPQGLSGWDDGVDVRREAIDIPLGHGQFDMPGYLGSRLVSVKGAIIAPSEAELEHKGARLRGLLAGGDIGRLVVDQLLGPGWADVRLATRPVVVRRDENTADYQVQFWAPNPRKFGEARTFSGSSVSVYHYGNFDAFPVVTVAGVAAGGYTISGPSGRSVVVTRALTSGNPHTVDFARAALLVNGTRVIGGLGTWKPWPVPPGARVAMSINNGLSMSVEVTDTSV